MSQVKESITPEKIIEIVAKYYQINKNSIVAKTRNSSFKTTIGLHLSNLRF